MKKEYTKKDLEENTEYWRNEGQKQVKVYQNKYLFWLPLGIVGAIFILGSVAFLLISNINDSPNYTIYENQCDNISTAKDCQCLERVKWNGAEFNCKVINESSCIYYYVPVCNKIEVDEITWISQDCVAHSSSNIEALNNCIFVIDKKDLNEGWLFSHGECIEYNCQGKECKRGVCHIYKIGSYEVKVE
jgi:hypothetical protein